MAALDEARARYFPGSRASPRATRAPKAAARSSCRSAHALNPAYQTLNDLLVAQGQQPQFPVVQDETIAFLREREQDTRITLRMPLIAPAIPAAVRAQRELLGASEYAHVALGAPPQARHHRRLPRLARRPCAPRASSMPALALLNENLRVNDSLFRNGKITQDQVLRARAELLAVTQQSREARNGAAQARSYLNFLLNRAARHARSRMPTSAPTWRHARSALAELRPRRSTNRPELAQLARSTRASEAQTCSSRGRTAGRRCRSAPMAASRARNTNSAAAATTRRSRCCSTGRSSTAARAAPRCARRTPRRRKTATQLEELTQQVQLEVQQSLDRLNTSADSLATAEARAEAARAAFRIASRKRDEGAISQVEFIDARSSLTGAELNLNVTRFEVLARQAELDYATAAGTLPLRASPTVMNRS